MLSPCHDEDVLASSKELVVHFHLSHKSLIGRIFVSGLHVVQDVHVPGALQPLCLAIAALSLSLVCGASPMA